MADTVLVHPNRDKAESKATRAVVILLFITSAALILIVTIGGWSLLQGAQVVAFVYALVYLGMAFFVSRWNRGVLPVGAALAILFSVIAAVAGPAWFDRDKPGFDEPTLDPSILGLLTLIRRGRPLRRRRSRPDPARLTRRPLAPYHLNVLPGWRNGIRDGLKSHCPSWTCGFESHPGY